MTAYLRGYSAAEATRLGVQANLLEDLLHNGTAFADGAEVLEAGCGVGAQSMVLARRSPGARFTCVDISEASLAHARDRAAAAGITTARFQQANLLGLPFAGGSFEHVYMNFVLEHCGDPATVLRELHRVLRPGGSITITEPDHATTVFHPVTDAARAVFGGMLQAQATMGGDGRIGHRLFPLLQAAGFHVESVEPRPLYVDARHPDRAAAVVDGMFVPALETTSGNMIAHAGMDPRAVAVGLDDWRRLSADPGLVVCTTLFRAVARRID